MIVFVRSALVALFLLPVTAVPQAADLLPVSRLEIISADGRQHAVTVEVAADPQTRETGLMERKKLAPDHGMIFVFPVPQEVDMWMKDTLIPLDMLFIDAYGSVITIRHDAKPMDETIIPSEGEAAFVLEMPGGYAKAQGIAEGARVSGPAMALHASQ